MYICTQHPPPAESCTVISIFWHLHPEHPFTAEGANPEFRN